MKSTAVCLIVILILLVAGITRMYIYERSERIRFADNYDILANAAENAERLHNGELFKYHKDLDSLKDVIGNIRTKTVKTVFQVKYNYKDSNLLIPIPFRMNVYDTVTVYFNKYMISKPCYDLELININDTIREKLIWHDKLTGFVHWERLHKFWFIRWGRKQYFLKLFSECRNDTIRVDKLIIFE